MLTYVYNFLGHYFHFLSNMAINFPNISLIPYFSFFFFFFYWIVCESLVIIICSVMSGWSFLVFFVFDQFSEVLNLPQILHTWSISSYVPCDEHGKKYFVEVLFRALPLILSSRKIHLVSLRCRFLIL